MTTTRGRRDPSLLEKGPAASTSVADLERQRQAQLAAVAEVEAAMRAGASAPEEPEEVLVDLETKEPVGPTAQERYEARVAAMPADEPRWVVGARAKNLQVEGHTLKRGDVVPGAHTWPRRGSWESAGYIERE